MSLLIFKPHECKVLIEKIKSCASDAELLDELSQIKCWTYGKVCSMYTYYWNVVFDSSVLSVCSAFKDLTV